MSEKTWQEEAAERAAEREKRNAEIIANRNATVRKQAEETVEELNLRFVGGFELSDDSSLIIRDTVTNKAVVVFYQKPRGSSYYSNNPASVSDARVGLTKYQTDRTRDVNVKVTSVDAIAKYFGEVRDYAERKKDFADRKTIARDTLYAALEQAGVSFNKSYHDDDYDVSRPSVREGHGAVYLEFDHNDARYKVSVDSYSPKEIHVSKTVKTVVDLSTALGVAKLKAGKLL